VTTAGDRRRANLRAALGFLQLAPRAAWRGLIGYGLLVVGFLCQLYAAWPGMP
jgi:hypothetical protein